MTYTLKTALSVAALVGSLAAAPVQAQNFGSQLGGGVTAGGLAAGNFAAPGGGGYAGAHAGGGFGGGGRVMTAPSAPAAVPQFQAPVVLPQAHVPRAYPGGGVLAAPRVGPTMVNPGQWTGGGLPSRGGIVRQPRSWPQAGAPQNHDATLFHGGGRHHHGRGHWRGGVWVPYVVGGYDPYPAYGVYDDEEECVMRKVRVHTRHGWKRVWRRVCT